ncbi:IS1634 family transposase [Azonexus hydrophilus]|uniref:IS1634 family transposase n=1 Tax=Azonexus hydrophilus TaxID=418702 RepID=UPI001965D652|nr:IS1634 family transposase [Azonexus hydrophilus]
MFLKITRSGPRQYLQLVEAFRDDAGKAKHRTLVTLGRLDQLTDSLDSVISGLLKVTGRPDFLNAPLPAVEFESARALGNVWALNELLDSLGFGELRRVFKKTRHSIDIEALIRVMVFNRLCDPESKLGVLRWLDTVAMPGVEMESITHQHLLRSMDALVDHQTEVDAVVANLLRPLIDQELSVVFYDMTTIRTEGTSDQEGDVRRFGMAKEGLIARQVMLGVVQTGDGLPIYHEVFAGNTAESPTLLPTLKTVLERFPSIRRVVLVADRGLLSLDNLEALSEIRLESGEPLEFVLAVPGRRYSEFAELLDTFQAQCVDAEQEIVAELPWRGLRLVVAHDPDVAKDAQALRRERIEALEAQASAWVGKLDAQDAGVKARGKKLSDSGAKAQLYHAVKEAHLANIIRVDLKSELFAYEIDPDALALAELMDGKLLLVTNTPDLSPQGVVDRYKSLADIERGFRVLKSEIEIGPVFHRLPGRIKAHAAICFIALILYRVMRQRLRSADAQLSPERALAELQKLQHHQIRINQAERPVTGISRLSETQDRVFAALKLKKPTQPQQFSLL